MSKNKSSSAPAHVHATIDTSGFPLVYTNLASLTINPHDIRIFFAETLAKEVIVASSSPVGTKPTESVYLPRTGVTMTPEFAKSLHAALETAITTYERQFGAIRAIPQAGLSRTQKAE